MQTVVQRFRIVAYAENKAPRSGVQGMQCAVGKADPAQRVGLGARLSVNKLPKKVCKPSPTAMMVYRRQIARCAFALVKKAVNPNTR